MAKSASGRHHVDLTASAFDFTEARCRQAWEAVRDGSLATDSNNRRWWRDLGCKQLKMMATPSNAAFYRVGRVGTKVVFQRLGSLDDLRVADARRSCDGLRSDATLAAKVAPSRRRTGRLTVGEAWKAYYADAESGRFVVGRPSESARHSLTQVAGGVIQRSVSGDRSGSPRHGQPIPAGGEEYFPARRPGRSLDGDEPCR